ncbi:ATP-dependent DNA helicase UvrD2 [Corynebacterium mendelii]|uniref:DNA 3'-5' helicase n=1 Tax=Corynebacterium mendelii TaxID=2765362 RepID=A0A939E0I8_9CORY|nr:ATP-dependent DNA helicase UvrD2 [Corynebacterium mendelii]
MGFDVNDLDDNQRQAALAPRGPVCILAGAGTGKTRTIIYRIASLIDRGLSSPERMLAVTYTAKAATEMRQRLAGMGIPGVQARTFHASARMQLRHFWPQVYGNIRWELVDNPWRMIQAAVAAHGLNATTTTVRDVREEISWAKATLISPADYAATVAGSGRTPPVDATSFAAIYRDYEQSKVRDDVVLLDFDDLLVHIAAMMEQSPAVAEEFRARYRSFTVDEYQDVTPLQQRVLNAWLGPRTDITVVGDANQTIYSFTGATPDYLLNFSRTYPDATMIRLQRDYRSTPQITRLANTVIGKARGRVAATRLTLEGMRPAGDEPSFTAYATDDAEADGVAAAIKDLIDGGALPSQIAVLYRINAQSQAYENSLARIGVAYQVKGGKSFFSRPEVTRSVGALSRAARTPATAGLSGTNLRALVNKILADNGLSPTEPAGRQAKEQWRALSTLKDLCLDLVEADSDLDTAGLAVELSRRGQQKESSGVEAVTLTSLHAAKGLEWDTVFLVGLTEGSVPISQAIKSGDYQIEEERRLFYVGVTRAREKLLCSWAIHHSADSRTTRTRTRFLDGIVDDGPTNDRGQRADRAKRRLTASRRGSSKRCPVCGAPLDSPAAAILGHCEDCAGDTNPEAVAGLRQWRRDLAKEKNVPAYIIFTDATLLAIAEALPANREELLTIAGIGPMKMAEYGDDLLALVAQWR